MAPSVEIIYNRRNTPAVGVNVILVPNMTMWTTWLRADSGNGRTRIPHGASSRPGVRTSVLADQTKRGFSCPNLSTVLSAVPPLL